MGCPNLLKGILHSRQVCPKSAFVDLRWQKSQYRVLSPAPMVTSEHAWDMTDPAMEGCRDGAWDAMLLPPMLFVPSFPVSCSSSSEPSSPSNTSSSAFLDSDEALCWPFRDRAFSCRDVKEELNRCDGDFPGGLGTRGGRGDGVGEAEGGPEEKPDSARSFFCLSRSDNRWGIVKRVEGTVRAQLAENKCFSAQVCNELALELLLQ
jgi:hypothetical protein